MSNALHRLSRHATIVLSVSLPMMLASALPSQAYVYTFSGASATFNDNPTVVEQISGSFTADPVPYTISNGTITLTGGGQEDGLYTLFQNTNTEIINFERVDNAVLTLGFSSSLLANTSTVDLNYANFGIDASSLSGGVTLAPAVPEPSTWAMMLLGFAGVGFMAYRRRNSAMLAA